ncbi:MAG: DUF3422 family protein [Pseudomonadota bacterium]
MAKGGAGAGGRRPNPLKHLKWDGLTKLYSAEAHDRPSPPLFAPCISFGFSLRPEAGKDPIESDTPTEQGDRRLEWVEKINVILAAFEDERFRPAGAVETDRFALTRGSYTGRGDGESGAEKDADRFRLVSKNFRIRWNNKDGEGARWRLPGYVVVDQQHEYTSFLFTLSLRERDAPRLKPTASDLDPADLVDPTAETPRLKPLPWPEQRFPEDTLPHDIENALDYLSTANFRGYDDLPDDHAEKIKSITKLLIDGVWDQFLIDLKSACRDLTKDGAPKLDFIDSTSRKNDVIAWINKNDVVFPGEAFSSLKGVVVRQDQFWDQIDDKRERPSRYFEKEAYNALEDRRLLLREFFNDGLTDLRNREFIGSRIVSKQAIHVTTLGSTQFDSALENKKVTVSADDVVSPTRYFVMLKDRPDAPQLGRMIERLHTLETLRIASVIDIDDLRDMGVGLRHEGARLDRWFQSERKSWFGRQSLEKIIGNIAGLGENVRGGPTYRISQASLYQDAYARAIEDLREDRIETWQPYEIFIRRRLQESFDFFKEVEDRRDFIFQRVQILLQRNLERETNANLRSTDNLSLLAAFIAPTTLFVSIHETMTDLDLMPWLRRFLENAIGVEARLAFEPSTFPIIYAAAQGIVVGAIILLCIRALFPLLWWPIKSLWRMIFGG